MKVLFFVLFLAGFLLAGDELKEATELCGTNPDGSMWFSQSLVKLLASDSVLSQYIFSHRGNKETKIYFDPVKKIFTVRKNFSSSKEENTSKDNFIIDASGKKIEVEWQ